MRARQAQHRGTAWAVIFHVEANARQCGSAFGPEQSATPTEQTTFESITELLPRAEHAFEVHRREDSWKGGMNLPVTAGERSVPEMHEQYRLAIGGGEPAQADGKRLAKFFERFHVKHGATCTVCRY